jgi:hypothetical protein
MQPDKGIDFSSYNRTKSVKTLRKRGDLSSISRVFRAFSMYSEQKWRLDSLLREALGHGT